MSRDLHLMPLVVQYCLLRQRLPDFNIVSKMIQIRPLFRPALALAMSLSITAPSQLLWAATVAKAADDAQGKILTGQSVPGLPGYVRSPYTNPPQLVNVGDAAPGSTVVCPFTQKPFIVPGEAPSVVKNAGQKSTSAQPAVKHALSPSPVAAIPPPSGKSVKDAAIVLPTEDSSWRVSIGAQWRQIGSLDWQTGSAASGWSLPWMAGRGTNSGGSSVPQGQGDHSYDDGFVNADAGTPFTGTTWFWGYNNASQVQGNDLVFRGSGGSSSYSRSSWSSVRNSSWSDELEGAGIFAKLESPELLKLGSIGVSLELTYSWAQDDSSKVTRDVFRAGQSSRVTSGGGSFEDRYDVAGILLPLAPYAGTYAGPGVTIPNAPYSRTYTGGGGGSVSNTQSILFNSDVRESFEVNLHTISLGPKFSANFGQALRLGLSTGFALNIADWDAQYEEALTVRQNGGRPRTLKRWEYDASGTEVLPGFYIETMAEVRMTDRVSAYVGGRYDWSKSMSENIGPSRMRFEPGGWSVMAGVTFKF